MSTTTELVVKALLGLVAVTVLYRRLDRGRHGKVVLAGLAGVAALAFVNFGTFHRVRMAHHSELYHYVLGSKYFSELGYDGLYVASLQAQAENAPDYPWPAVVRDLRTNRLVHHLGELDDHQREVRARFDEVRWRAFVADHQYFLDHSHPAYVDAMRADHGYNATPVWTAVARLFVSWLGVGWGSLLLLTLLDPLLLAVMFVVLGRTFGFAPAAWALTIFGLAFLSRYHWVGGAFLRHDWLCAAVVGICMIEKGRPVLAGVALGYAAAVRIFPALLLFGIALWLLRRWLRGEERRHAAWLFAAVVGTLVGAIFLGALAGRGFDSWTEFFDAITLHRSGWSGNRVGLFTSLVHSYDFLVRSTTAWNEVAGLEAWLARVADFRAHWWPLRALVVVLLLGAVARAAWVRGSVESAVLGLVVIYALTEPASYYWSILLVTPVIRRRGLTLLVLGYSALLCLLAAMPHGAVGVYGVATHGMLAIYVTWLLPDKDAPEQDRSPRERDEGEPSSPKMAKAPRSGSEAPSALSYSRDRAGK
ncbi:MAG: DUF2029 domain-containing protein [Deltaproteobacteria bacterium]|nr:DUF2029 domain-containing protein [Deltaproteobacteria bacterium]